MKAQKLYPLWIVNVENSHTNYQVIESSALQAMRRVQMIFKKAGWLRPAIKSVTKQGTIDYIPTIKKPHYEF